MKLEILVGADGSVSEARVLSGADALLDQAALQAARGLRFWPATSDGHPVSAYIEYEYRFEPPPLRAVLAGEVRRRGRNERVAGSTVEAGGASTVTDAQGRFALEVPAETELAVHVTVSGMRPLLRTEKLKAGERLELIYYLGSNAGAYETTVVGQRERREVSRIDLKREELRAVPGTMGDPFRAILALPGVAAAVSGLAFPVVRGAAPASTGWFLDGVRLPHLFHFFALSAVVHPSFIESIEFYPGAYPADFGRLTGGVVSAQTATGRTDSAHGEATLDLLNSGGFVESPVQIGGQRLSLAAAGRFAYPGVLFSLLQPRAYADYWDYQTRAELPLPRGGGSLRLFVFGSRDETGEKNSGIQQRTTEIVFHRADLRWRGRLANAAAEASLTAGADALGLGPTLDLSARSLAPRLALSWKQGPWALRVGGDAEWKRVHAINHEKGMELEVFKPVSGWLGGLYAELSFAKGPWTVIPSMRTELYQALDASFAVPEPRLSARYRLDPLTTLKLGGGLFHQAPTAFLDAPGIDLFGLDRGLQESRQVAAGMERRIEALGVDVDVTGYWSEMTAVRELPPGNDPDVEALMLSGACGNPGQPACELDPFRKRRGRSVGLEILVRRKLGERFFGWVAYTLSRTTRWTPGYDIYPFQLDQTHILNVIGSYDLGAGWTTGLGLHFNTGKPYDQMSLVDQPWTSGNSQPGVSCAFPGANGNSSCWVPERPLGGRLPPFFRADLRLEKRWIKDRYTIAGYLDVLNATFSQEVLARNYTFDGQGNPLVVDEGVPILVPMLGARGSF